MAWQWVKLVEQSDAQIAWRMMWAIKKQKKGVDALVRAIQRFTGMGSNESGGLGAGHPQGVALHAAPRRAGRLPRLALAPGEGAVRLRASRLNSSK